MSDHVQGVRLSEILSFAESQLLPIETNAALSFERDKARGMRLDIPAGTAVRFEPGQKREVNLVPYGGKRRVFGFQGKISGKL